MNSRYNRAWVRAKRAALLTRRPQYLCRTPLGWRFGPRPAVFAWECVFVSDDYLT